jgi:hypothetical protein
VLRVWPGHNIRLIALGCSGPGLDKRERQKADEVI